MSKREAQNLRLSITAMSKREAQNPRLNITAVSKRGARNPGTSITAMPRRRAQNPHLEKLEARVFNCRGAMRLSCNCPHYRVNYCPRNEGS